MTTPNEPVSARERLRLTRGLLAELDVLDLELDLVAPDRDSAAAGDDAGDFLVAGGGLRIVLKIHWTPLSAIVAPTDDPAILTVAQTLLSAAPDVDAVVVVLPPAPYRSVVVDAFAAGTAVEVPSGSARELPKGAMYPAVRDALRDLVAPPDIDWSGLPTQPLVSSITSLVDQAGVTAFTEAAAADLRAQGGRAQRDGAKHQTWQAIDASDTAWAATRVHGAFNGTATAGQLASELDAYLDEPTP